MKEVLNSWVSILNSQYHKTILEFQNVVKYHEETLAKIDRSSNSQPPCLPNWQCSNSQLSYCKAHVNLVSVILQNCFLCMNRVFKKIYDKWRGSDNFT